MNKPLTRAQLAAPDQRLDDVRQVFLAQARALHDVAQRVSDEVLDAIELMLATRGRVVIAGMGKSGIIGKKIAATLSSTGTPSLFVHPADAFHGDLGMIRADDVVILISYSGETDEVLKLLPYLRHIGAPLIAITGGRDSTLARHATVTLDVAIERETCPHNLAPTTSTTATLVMGDALAIALIHARGFLPNDFARFHPGGALGRKLLTRVRDVMHANYAHLSPDDGFMHIMGAMTRTRLGLAVVADAHGSLLGVISDGDMVRAMQSSDLASVNRLAARDFMTCKPIVIRDTAMFTDAERLMAESEVTCLVAVDDDGRPCGVVKVFDVKSR